MHSVIQEVRLGLIRSYPFYSHIMFKTELIEEPDRKVCPTMQTDGRRIWYNSKFVDELVNDHSKQHVGGVIIHELMHIAFMHCVRRKPSHVMWNWATDFIINSIIIDSGIKLPPKALHNIPFTLKTPSEYRPNATSYMAKRSADDLYQEIYDNLNNPDGHIILTRQGTFRRLTNAELSKVNAGEKLDLYIDPNCRESEYLFSVKGGGSTSGETFDQVKHNPNEVENSQVKKDVIDASVYNSMKSGNGCGKLPKEIVAAIEAYTSPRINWRDFIKARLSESVGGKEQFTNARPNRRYIHQGIYLPSMVDFGIGKGVIALDTSGSVSNKELSYYLGEIISLIEMMTPDQVDVIFCDAAIHKVTDMNDDFSKIECTGRGGTSFQPVFDWVKDKKGDSIDWLIYFTDMECSFPAEPNYHTIWASSARREVIAPFGSTVRVYDGEEVGK